MKWQDLYWPKVRNEHKNEAEDGYLALQVVKTGMNMDAS